MSYQAKSITPVLIVGAGPVGLLLGLQLQRFGIPHRLIDKRLQRQTFSKAFAIHSRSMEVFEDLGLLDQLLARAVRVEQMNIYSNRKRLITYNLGQLDVPFPFTASIPQNCVEEILETRYLESGGRIERGIELHSLTQNEHAAHATLNDEHGNWHSLECTLVAGCDGGFSHVRKTSGIAFDGAPYKRPYIIADGTLSWKGENSSGHVFTSGDGYMMLFPLPGGKHRVVIDCEDSTLTTADLNIERVNARLHERGFEDITLSDPLWLSVTTFQHRLAEQYRVGRVFLAGDACHVHSPIGGQGLNTGLQDAYNLSWKIAHVLNHDASQALLDSYQAERRPVAQTVLKNTQQQMRMLNMKHPLLRLLRDALVPTLAKTRRFQNRIIRQATGFQIDYSTTLLAPQARQTVEQGPVTGQRMPDGTVLEQNGDARRLFELLKGIHYSVFVFEDNTPDSEAHCQQIAHALSAARWPANFLRAYLIRNPASTDSTICAGFESRYDMTDVLREQLGVENGGLFLVRPDGYLALRCDLAQGAQLNSYFERFYPAFNAAKRLYSVPTALPVT